MASERRLGALPLEIRLGLVAGVAAVLWAAFVLQPLGAATIDPDASSSVLYFDRIISGQRLEAFVPTTPKPLLTLLYGISWAIGHDWRWLVWETIAAWGLAVGATAALVAGLSGRAAVRAVGAAGAASAAQLAGAGFVTAALLGSSDLLLEVSRANSLVWALAGWSIAGLAATASPSRPVVAGIALLLAGLCRFETLGIAAVAVVAVALWRRRTMAGPAPRLVPGIVETADQFATRRASVRTGITIGAMVGAFLAVAAILIALLHDWLLTGDPFYWLAVPSRYTAIYNAGLGPVDPLTYAGTLIGRLAPEWPLILLAAIGVVALGRTRQWLPLGGIAAIGLGVVALLFWLATRAIYISNRYYEPIDLALIVAAAVGVGWLASRLPVDRPGIVPIAAAAAAIAGIAVMWPALPWDRRASTELGDVRRASEHLAAVRPELDRALENSVMQLLVPSRDVSRVSLESGQRLDRVIDSYALLLRGGVEALEPGQVVFHDGAADRPVALYRPLEIDDQAPLSDNILVRLEPRVADIWILSVR